MKRLSAVALLSLAVAFGSLAWADHHEGGEQHEKAWSDAAHCQICKPWSEHQELMISSKWETHPTANGMLIATQVPKAQMETFAAVEKEIDANVAKIDWQNEKPELCGFCQSISDLMAIGSKLEKVETSFGNIMLVSSDSPDTVAKIHEVAKRAQAEEKKMMAAMK